MISWVMNEMISLDRGINQLMIHPKSMMVDGNISLVAYPTYQPASLDQNCASIEGWFLIKDNIEIQPFCRV